MNSIQQLKNIETRLRAVYPILRQSGIYTPDKNGLTMLDRGQVLALFNEKSDEQYLIDVAHFVASGLLKEALADKKLKADDRPVTLNQYFDFAQTLLLHHSVRLSGLYKNNIEELEELRGDYLSQVAHEEDSTPSNWTEYAYWLAGRVEKFKESDPVKAENFSKDTEEMFRKAHEAGHIEATEALATFLYVERDQTEEPIALWEKAASTGLKVALDNLFNVVSGDDSLTHEEKNHSLMAIWEGVAINPKGNKDLAKLLRNSGLTAPVAPAEIRAPA